MNLARVLADCPKEQYKYLRVLNNTLNVTNGPVLIRRFAQLPDGVYQVDIQGRLKEVRYPFGLQYPDIEMIKPDFQNMKPWCELPNQIVGAMLVLCNQIKELDGTAIIRKNIFYMKQNPEVRLEYNFGLPQHVEINPVYLGIILREMLNYDVVYLLREHNPAADDNSKYPLIFGKNWGSCALLMPMKNSHIQAYGQEERYFAHG